MFACVYEGYVARVYEGYVEHEHENSFFLQFTLRAFTDCSFLSLTIVCVVCISSHIYSDNVLSNFSFYWAEDLGKGKKRTSILTQPIELSQDAISSSSKVSKWKNNDYIKFRIARKKIQIPNYNCSICTVPHRTPVARFTVGKR